MENKIDDPTIKPDIMKPKKRGKSFMEYYADPIYKAKHQAYMQAKVPCSACGLTTARSNMAKHRRTKRHLQVIDKVSEAENRWKQMDMPKIKEMILAAIQKM